MLTDFELTAIDRHFADFIARQSGDPSPLPGRVASLVSAMLANASICLQLADIAARDLRIDGEEVRFPPLEELRESLRNSVVVGSPGDFRPLVLDEEDRLYLYRYWKYERDLARFVLERAVQPAEPLDRAVLADGVRRLFPSAGDGIDWQLAAVLAALRKRFCVISGGPGTGKTSTVVRILALLLEQAGERPPRIALAAPTGKAAARLMESIDRMRESLDCGGRVRELIPREVSTLHRLLGARHGSRRFRHSESDPLPFDVVVVDEASMVDLPLMARLAVALKPDARLILLGDRDQLASVEAGAVLGDMCGAGRREFFSAEFSAEYGSLTGAGFREETSPDEAPPLADSVVVLKRNYRFGDDSGIALLAGLVNDGMGRGALELMESGTCPELVWQDVPPPEGLKKVLGDVIAEGFGPYLDAAGPEEALARFDEFRLLCAMRRGPYGAAAVNALVEGVLALRGMVEPLECWYRGRPVMVIANDYNLRLFNGDIGVVFPDAGGRMLVHFPVSGGGVRTVSPLRMPPHETVYAMTVHKSQGSEFGRVMLLLPPHDTEIMTRELVYTGITRARERVEIRGRRELFVGAVARRVERKSGLMEALWGKELQ